VERRAPCPSMTGDGRAPSAQTVPEGASVPIVFIDCSAIMRRALDHLGLLLPLRMPRGLEPPLVVNAGDPTPQELAALLSEARVVLNGHTILDEGVLSRATHLRSIVFLGTGASTYIDMSSAARRGIRVRTVRHYADRTVAEHALALLLSAARDIARMDRDIRAGRWSASEGLELAGRTLGVVGVGGVGAQMARIAAAVGMRVMAWNRSGIPAGVPAEPAQLDTLLATCDAVSLHVALVPQTRGLIDARRLGLMRAGAILVNTARGALVDEAALIAALQTGRLAHAALDVFDGEPVGQDHPLARLENVTLTSHAAWKSQAASRRLLQLALALAAEDARRLAAGEPLAP
jgi:D-3-phosphoglycerate dehydrogenase / 2-oxoglutarate reductase